MLRLMVCRLSLGSCAVLVMQDDHKGERQVYVYPNVITLRAEADVQKVPAASRWKGVRAEQCQYHEDTTQAVNTYASCRSVCCLC